MKRNVFLIFIVVNIAFYSCTKDESILNERTLIDKLDENSDSIGFNKIFDFHYQSSGHDPNSIVILDSIIYGVSFHNLRGSYGNIYCLKNDSSSFKKIYNLEFDYQWEPFGSITAYDNKLYGTVKSGGLDSLGYVFTSETDGSGFILLHEFNGFDGFCPNSISIKDDVIYGTTYNGGKDYKKTINGLKNDRGTVFRLNIDGSNFQTLRNFTSDDITVPKGNIVVCNNVIYGITKDAYSIAYSESKGSIYKINIDGSEFKILHSFYENDGDGLIPNLILKDDILYGTTGFGGVNGAGTIFKIDINGNGYSQIHSFNHSDGYMPTSIIDIQNTSHRCTTPKK